MAPRSCGLYSAMKNSDRLEVFRCHTCGLLLTDRMIRKGECSGHRIQYAIRGTPLEWIILQFRLKILEPFLKWKESS